MAEGMVYVDIEGGTNPRENMPGAFTYRRSALQTRQISTGEVWFPQSLDAEDQRVQNVIQEMNAFHYKISEQWRDSYHERVIELATEALDRLHELKNDLDYTAVFLRYERWIYKFLGHSLRSITGEAFERLSRKINFHYDNHFLASWKYACVVLFRSADFDSRLKCGEDVQWTRQDGEQWTADACNHRDCSSYCNAALALLRYIGYYAEETEIDGYMQASVKLIKQSFRCRNLVNSRRPAKCAWDRYLVQRVYMIACIRGRPDIQDMIIENAELRRHVVDEDCPDDNHNDLSSLEDFIDKVSDEVSEVAFPKRLLNLKDHERPTQLQHAASPTVQSWWLTSAQRSNPEEQPFQHRAGMPRSVENTINSAGPFGQGDTQWTTIRGYDTKLMGVYGQLPHNELITYFKETTLMRKDSETLVEESLLQSGRRYHARIFQYQPVDDLWYYNNCIFEVTKKLDVEPRGALRDVFEANVGHYGKRIAKRYREGGRHLLKSYLGAVRTQAVARCYARSFNTSLAGRGKYRLSVLRADHLQVFKDSDRLQVIDMFNIEEDGRPNQFSKFSILQPDTVKAPTGDHLTPHNLCASFSHHTYKESDGRLVVSDLQGFVRQVAGEDEIVLTDPAIHAPDAVQESFGCLNAGHQGVKHFFTHLHRDCNRICIMIHLHEHRPYRGNSLDTDHDHDDIEGSSACRAGNDWLPQS